MIQFLAQGIDMPLWLLLILIVIIAVLIVAMFLRPSIPVFSNAEERKAEIALFEDRLQGVLLVDRSQSLRDLERALRIGS